MNIRAWSLIVICMSSGCAFFHRSSSDPAAADGGEDRAPKPHVDAGVDAGGDAGTSGGGGTATRDAGASPGSTEGGYEVWIGQLWSTSTILCSPDDEKPVVAPEGALARVALVLDGRDGDVTGRIQFGEPIAGLTKTPWPNGADSKLMFCSIETPTQGGEYTMFDLVRTTERLSFSISPAEYWDDWCHEAKVECPAGFPGPCTKQPACVCESGACDANLRNRLTFQLTFTNTTLEGPFASPHFGSVADIRLRRVK